MTTALSNKLFSHASVVGVAVGRTTGVRVALVPAASVSALRSYMRSDLSLSTRQRVDFGYLLDSGGTSDVRLCWDVVSGSFRFGLKSADQGAPGTVPIPGGGESWERVALERFGLVCPLFATQPGFVAFTSQVMDGKPGLCFVTMAGNAHQGETTTSVVGVSTYGFTGIFTHRGVYDVNKAWWRGPQNANIRSALPFASDSISYRDALLQCGALVPSASQLAVVPWTRFQTASQARIVGRGVLATDLIGFGLLFAPTEEEFDVEVFDPALATQGKFPRVSRGTFDIEAGVMRAAINNVLTDADVLANGSAVKTQDARGAAEATPLPDLAIRVSTYVPFQIPAIETWQTDLQELDPTDLFLKKPDWSRNTFNAKYKGNSCSVLACALPGGNADADYTAIMTEVSTGVYRDTYRRGGFSVELSAIEQDATVFASDVHLRQLEPILAAARPDITLAVKSFNDSALIPTVPIIPREGRLKADANRFIAVKSYVNCQDLERAAFTAVYAAMKSYNHWLAR